MKSLYHIRVKDKTTKSSYTLDIENMQHIRVESMKNGVVNEYDLDFTDSNPGLVEDIVKAAEWLRIKLNEQESNIADCYIDTEIFTSSIEFNGKDDIWECLTGVYDICRGEHMIQHGSSIISQGYNTLERHVRIN